MISHCPECQLKLDSFAIACSCGWSVLAASGEPAPNIQAVQADGAGGSLVVEPAEIRIDLGPETSHRRPDRQVHRAPAAVAQEVSTGQASPVGMTAGQGNPADLSIASDSSIDLGVGLPADSQTSLVINDVASSSVIGLSGDETNLPPSQVELQVQRAKELIAEEEFSKSLAYLSRAIGDAAADRRAECFSLRGYVYYRMGEVERAEEACTEAILQNWEDANTYAWRAAARGEQNKWRLAFDDLQAACDIAQGNRDEYFRLMDSYSQAARSYFQEEARQGNDTADLFSERGWVYYRRSNAAKAERDFKQALQRDENHGWASMGLALVHREAGVYQHLTRLLQSALGGDLECKRLALKNCAELHWEQGDVSAANKDLAKLTHLAADNNRAIVEVGRIRSQLGDHVGAIDQLSRLISVHPDEHFAWLVRAKCYQAIKNYPLAIKDFTRFLRFFPDHVDALVHRAESYIACRKFPRAHEDLDIAEDVDEQHYYARLLRSRLMLQEDRLDSALTECEAAIRLDNRAEAFGTKAQIYHKLCDYSAAIEEFSRAIEMSHQDNQLRAEYLYHRGTILYELEDYEGSFNDFEASCDLRPNHSGSWVWLAATASRLERWPKAITSLQLAIEARPAAAAAYQKLGKPVANKAVDFFDRQQQRGQATQDSFRHRGLAHQFLQNHEQALADFTKALEATPDDVGLLTRRGQTLTQLGRHKEAVADFTKVIKQQPQNHEARYHRAISRMANGKLDRATTDIRKAIKVAPEHPKYHILLSELHQAEGDLPKVIRSLDKAVLRDPTDSLTYRRRAAVHLSSGDLLRAIRDFTHAIELDPSQFEILVARGNAYLKSEQLSLALEDFELALTHNPKLAKAYSGRATALVADDRHEYTLIWLTKAIHRFESPRDLAEILFARGKVFAQMGRLALAASDFSSVIDLVRQDVKTLVAARHARAIANIQGERFDKAIKDYQRILKVHPNDRRVQQVVEWLENPQSERPGYLPKPISAKRPTRPPVVRAGVTPDPESIQRWTNDPPHDTWVIRTADHKEYGPVKLNILKTWISDGRIDLGMKLLRADWSKWKRAEKIFPEILPFHGPASFVEDFPGINL